MTLDEYVKKENSMDAIFSIQEVWMARYGVEIIPDEDIKDADGKIVFAYTLPEHIDLPDELAILEDDCGRYDMRCHEDILALMSRFITDFLCSKAELFVLYNNDYETDEEKNILMNYMTKSLADKTDANFGIRWGKTWSEDDYYSGIDYYNSRVVDIDWDTSDEVTDLIISKYKEEFGGDVGVADFRDNV